VLALGTQAFGQGTIVYHNPGVVPLFSSGGVSYQHGMDLDRNGVTDFVFEAYTNFQIYSTTGNRTVGIPNAPGELGSWSAPLNSGVAISLLPAGPMEWVSSEQGRFTGNWYGAFLHTRNFSGSAGYWNPPAQESFEAFVGVEFAIDQNTHYGWIRVEVFGNVGNGGWIKDWAYNSVPSQPILAGQVPEPGTWALLSVGAGLLGWRIRRRKQTV